MPVRRIALLTIFAFGCATVRVPVTPLGEPADAAGVIAPPITELWIESSEAVPIELSAKTDAQARAALAEALAGREIPANAAGATDAVLFVRERAVATTEARQSQQTWAKVGIVVGIVLVVVAVVIIAVSGSKGSSSHSTSGKSAPSGPKAPAPVAVRPRALPPAPPRVSPPPTAPPRVIPTSPVPYFYRPWSPVFVGFYFDFWIPPRPLVLAPEAPGEEPWYAPEPPVPLASDAPPPFEEQGLLAPPPPEPDPVASVALQLPPLADTVNFKVEDRGFFAGPQTALQLDLLDRATGQLLWSKAVNADADPLDAGAVSKVLDEAFAGVGWARSTR